MNTKADFELVTFQATPAVSLDIFDLSPKEMMCYLYMPIKLIDSNVLAMEERLALYWPMVQAALHDYDQGTTGFEKNSYSRYVYITAKHLFVTPDNIGNRPGYHCDGFGTDDVNYIWADKYPTIFNSGQLTVRNDDLLALEDMNAQAVAENEYSLPEKSLIRIDSWCPHRTPVITESGFRTFVKISISKHRYNLEGNSHNFLLSYDWSLHERIELRNMENKDFQQDPQFR